MDFNAIMKMKQARDAFARNHPRVMQFLGAAQNRGIPEGTIVDLSVTYPDGTKMSTNLKVNQEDLELLEVLKQIR